MDITLRGLSSTTTDTSIIQTLAEKVLHNEDFTGFPGGPRINFTVVTKKNEINPTRNIGIGTLTLPTKQMGYSFLDWVRANPVRIDKRNIKFYHHRLRDDKDREIIQLRRRPYVDPEIIEERERLKDTLSGIRVPLEEVQFGVILSSLFNGRTEYSIEWRTEAPAKLEYDYDRKAFRIILGDSTTDHTFNTILLNLTNIAKIGVGKPPNGSPFVLFDNLTPPIFEQEDFYRSFSGDERMDGHKFKIRKHCLDDSHKTFAPYCTKLRLVLNNKHSDAEAEFRQLCKTAEMPRNLMRTTLIPASSFHSLFSPLALDELRSTFREFQEWSVVFQLEALLSNGSLHTGELWGVLPHIKQVHSSNPSKGYMAALLRTYHIALVMREPNVSHVDCFLSHSESFVPLNQPDDPRMGGSFYCHHIVFTPTRTILSGPYPTESNRIIRRFQGYEEHFVRVYFREEDRLRYQWDYEVDEREFLHQRVGTLLKNGFEIGGRRFEFLAYSNSSLREHTVWFMSPFTHPEHGKVTSDSIRSEIGDFWDVKEEDYVGRDTQFFKKDLALQRQPSKLAARIAQAFTSSRPSVTIHRSQWEIVPDLGKDPYLFTDGIGTISEELADEIWDMLRQGGADPGGKAIRPSAFKIRFIGFKGVVSVDRELGKTGGNIRMRLRPSMRKFGKRSEEQANIEIAGWPPAAAPAHLNRPLIMLLEDLGVRQQSFLGLTDKAIQEAYTVDLSLMDSSKFMKNHKFGDNFHLADIFEGLSKIGGSIGSGSKADVSVDNEFLNLLRDVGKKHVLRSLMHEAKILIPESYHLYGVADEGPAYCGQPGYEEVFTLKENQIFVCVQKADDDEPVYLTGACTISRSPVAHPGDVQRVHAIGKPPPNQICLFAHLRNVVVFPSSSTKRNQRSLPSCLGGGDLDGDEFDVIFDPNLLPSMVSEPASYHADPPRELPGGRVCTIDDVCDFVVEYIHSDVIGLLSIRLIILADQSQQGMWDNKCTYIAELCSKAVDYSKHGNPMDLYGVGSKYRLPPKFIPCDPDWNSAEVVNPRKRDYYESTKALGKMYRKVVAAVPEDNRLYNLIENVLEGKKECPNVSWAPVSSLLEAKLCESAIDDAEEWDPTKLFNQYKTELRYICRIYPLAVNRPNDQLLESEVVMGTILTKSSQKRFKKDRIYQMGLHMKTLAEKIRKELRSGGDEMDDEKEKLFVLGRAWKALKFGVSQAALEANFGANSFVLLVLDVVLKKLQLDTPKSP